MTPQKLALRVDTQPLLCDIPLRCFAAVCCLSLSAVLAHLESWTLENGADRGDSVAKHCVVFFVTQALSRMLIVEALDVQDIILSTSWTLWWPPLICYTPHIYI